MLTCRSFFNVSDFPDQQLFDEAAHVWQPLNDLKSYMDAYRYPKYDNVYIRDGIPLTEHIVLHKGHVLDFNDLKITYGDVTKGELQVKRGGMLLEGASVIMAGAILVGNKISFGRGVLVESGAMVKSPAIIGDMSEIRQGAYLRGYCLAGKRCVLGHTTEIKHSILLNDAKAGHFAYLGDSILGNAVNLGAGTKLANLKFLPGNVTVFFEKTRIDTGRRKLGVIMGDGCQTGCNSVTSPGTFMGQKAVVMPNVTVKGGYHKKNAIIR